MHDASSQLSQRPSLSVISRYSLRQYELVLFCISTDSVIINVFGPFLRVKRKSKASLNRNSFSVFSTLNSAFEYTLLFSKFFSI